MMISISRHITLLVLVLMLAACANLPATAEQTRQMAARQGPKWSESFVVNQSYPNVVATFKERTRQCLNKKVTTTVKMMDHRTSTWNHDTYYNSSIHVGKDKTELHIQQAFNGKTMAKNSDKLPEKGYYMMVVDIVPQGNRTAIKVSRIMPMEVVLQAVRDWARGNVKTCPDMTKV